MTARETLDLRETYVTPYRQMERRQTRHPVSHVRATGTLDSANANKDLVEVA
jgi:hypothetical protein